MGEDIAELQSFFSTQSESLLERFLPCAFGNPARPSWRCCRSLTSIFGAYEEATFYNCLCAPLFFDGLVDGFGDRFDIQTLYNSCAGKFPQGFLVNFNSTDTAAAAGVSRCVASRVDMDRTTSIRSQTSTWTSSSPPRTRRR